MNEFFSPQKSKVNVNKIRRCALPTVYYTVSFGDADETV